LDVEDWAEIRRLRRAGGLAISEIARVMGVARNTVKAALAAEGVAFPLVPWRHRL
jgi:transcriptional regulator with XRE-family HTH domain